MPITRRLFTALMSQSSILDLEPPAPGQRIPYGEDSNQFAELRLPKGKGPHPVVIFIHGGYWRAAYDLTHAGHFCQAITDAGHAAWSVEYRRTGQRGGGYPGTFEDIRNAAKRLTKIPNLDLQRVTASGHSAGGHLALWLAAQNVIELRSVVALAAVSDLKRAHELNLGSGAAEAFMGCSPNQCPDAWAASSPIDLLPIKVPQRLLHGTADTVVPFDLSQRFAQASKNARLIPLPETGHFELIDPRAKQWSTVLRNLTAGFLQE